MSSSFLVSLLMMAMTMYKMAWCVRIGIIGDLDPHGWSFLGRTGGAMSLAQERLIAEGIIRNDTIKNITWRHSVTEASGVGNVVDLVRDEDVDVIFGSASSFVTVPSAHLTSFWNVPHVTWFANSYDLSDKTLFTTLVRTAGPLSEAGNLLVTLFQRFGWTRIGLLNAEQLICSYSANGIKTAFAKANLTIMQSIAFPTSDPYSQDIVLSNATIDEYLGLLMKSCRIIFLCPNNFIVLRTFLIRACKLGMCKGDYLFILTYFDTTDQPWSWNDADDDIVKEAYKNSLLISIAAWTEGEGYMSLVDFEDLVLERSLEPPWNYNTAYGHWVSVFGESAYLYDAMYLYGLWLNHTLTHGHDHRDGAAWMEFSKYSSFRSATGPCDMGGNGDRVPNFWLHQFLGDDVKSKKVAISKDLNTRIDDLHGFQWNTADGEPPRDAPVCGFYNEACPPVPKDDSTSATVTAVLGCVAVGLLLICVVVIRRRMQADSLLENIWKVKLDDIDIQKPCRVGHRTSFKSQSTLSVFSDVSTYARERCPVTTVALYKSQTVTLKRVSKRGFLSKEELHTLKTMRTMQHDNLNSFLGACFDMASPCLLFLYCPKGSLQDILENDDIQLDTNFKNSLSMDLIQGMNYIHNSKLSSHGRLKSSNCLVDNRWMLKVTDYGISRFLDNGPDTDDDQETAPFKELLWTAPEHLVDQTTSGSKEGDVYSFGVILHEIFYRLGPFAGNEHLSTDDIIRRVSERGKDTCRPVIICGSVDVVPAITKLMQLCWHDNPQSRPTFSVVKTYVRKNIYKGMSVNIVDLILQRLEKYASNLEELVDQRTQQLLLEKQKSDKLLYRMLPRSCADKLKAGEQVIPEVFESATVFFSDIVGFTSIASQISPVGVVDLLNDLYTCFDAVIDDYDAYKVETIGDAYLVVSGIPKRNGSLHAGIIADMSLDIVKAVSSFQINTLPGEVVKVRIGNHTGACCAGIVGLSMPRYCLFGDTVNTASRMESNGAAQRIHISEDTSNALHKLGGYSTTFRADMEIKGKGCMKTHWLLGRSTDTSAVTMPTV